MRLVALLHLHHHHLDGDDRVIDQQAQRQDQRAERDPVEVLAGGGHHDEDRRQRQRNRRGDDDAHAPSHAKEIPSDGANGDGAADSPAARGIVNARAAADKGVAVDPAVFRAEIESISDEIRRICEDLSPSALDNVGLAAALEWALTNSAAHCRESERFEYEFVADENFDERLQVAPGVRMQLYRIAQEAITNVCRHARARRVRLTATISAGGELLLALEDDGRADFDPRARKARRGRGLSSIRDRASLIEAEADWERLPTGGTRFTLRKADAANDVASA